MSSRKNINEFIKNFNSENEDMDEEDEDYPDNYDNNQKKERIVHNQTENNAIQRKPTRNKFGYFIPEDDDDEENEESNSINSKKVSENNSIDSSEKEKDNSSNQECNSEDILDNNNNNKNEVDINNNKYNDEEENNHLKSQNSIEENKDKIKTIYTHDDNMISLGIIPNKDNIIKDNKYEQRNELNDNNKKDDEEKDNTTEDEDEILKKLRITESVEDDYNIKMKEINEKELSKEKKCKNEQKNNNENEKNKDINNKKNDNKVRDLSIDILNDFKRAGDSQKSLTENNILYNKNDSNMEIISLKNDNTNENNNKTQKKMLNEKSKTDKNKVTISRNDKYNSQRNYINLTEDKKQFSPINNEKSSKKDNTNYYNSNYTNRRIKNNPELDKIVNNLYTPKTDKKCEIKYTPKDCSFSPVINKKSREIYEKNIKNKRPKTPIGDILYEEANIRNKKMKLLYNKENETIKSKANETKTNNNSYNMAVVRIKKKIDLIINKYIKDGKMSVIGLTQCLFDLNIITELIKIKDNIEDNNDDLDIVELHSIIESINPNDTKKLQEVELLEQLWFKMNPKNNKYINSQVLSDFLKLLFSSSNKVKELIKPIEELFKKYSISNNNDCGSDEYDNNNNNNEFFLSPLTNKKYNRNELWPLSKMIEVFLSIIKNIKAYKFNNYKKSKIYNEIIAEKEKDLIFQPKLISNDYFNKYSNYDYNKDNNIIISSANKGNSKKTKHDFNKIYERFMLKKKNQEKTLEKIREMQQEFELKMCTNVPKINKPKNRNKISEKNSKTIEIDSENSKILKKNKSNININEPVYEKLYNKRKKNKDICGKNTKTQKYIEKDKTLNKTYSNLKINKKPKGYDEYIKRNREALKKREYKKQLEEDKKYGKNYEKVKKMNVKPFDITDLKKEKASSKNKDKSNNNELINNFGNENIFEDFFITVNVKIPNGLSKPLKIYDNNDDDTLETVNSFCKIYHINDDYKKIIYKKVIQYKKSIFSNKNKIENIRDGFIINEDFDTNTNACSNNSNPSHNSNL